MRGRRKRRLPAYLMTQGRRPGPAQAVAATVVGDGPARRVGLLAPESAVLPAGAPLLAAMAAGLVVGVVLGFWAGHLLP
ncbi:hypothetical protein G5V58_18135 [Nocardioides anomalus]|uniref:Uncharacterized protein n=1 Tax=Nocardioides anomalus TaxID=2712223 RepID=A0A6G6WH14_9ACTN|nr:hypothetical protein [Nocardioides anomalus]QIG44443.1 hypothetical protein G5V58_18135 [Nocardioides anomalus]